MSEVESQEQAPFPDEHLGKMLNLLKDDLITEIEEDSGSSTKSSVDYWSSAVIKDHLSTSVLVLRGKPNSSYSNNHVVCLSSEIDRIPPTTPKGKWDDWEIIVRSDDGIPAMIEWERVFPELDDSVAYAFTEEQKQQMIQYIQSVIKVALL